MELNVINCACEAEAIETGQKHKDELNAIVSRRVDLTKDLAILDIVPDGWDLPEFTPGQYVTIGLPQKSAQAGGIMNILPQVTDNKLIKRPYSIASGSNNKEFIELYLKYIESGALTPKLFSLKPGDRIWMSPRIKGKFTIDDVPDDQNIILVSRGTGLAPYMSILRTIILKNEDRLISVIHSARHSTDLTYRAELEAYDKECDNFFYIPVLSKPDLEPQPWKGYSGYIQKIWSDRILQDKWEMEISTDNTHVFLCGHPNMINDMTDVLETEGFKIHKNTKNPGTIHLEKYW